MKADFSKALSDFLTLYLPNQRNFSKNTISSYCDTFRLLLIYLDSEKNTSADKLSLKQINYEIIISFLDWLILNRNCSVSTRNQRLACLHTFFRFVQIGHPDLLFECKKILEIPFLKKHTPVISYLSIDDVKLLLKQPDLTKSSGRRDLALLLILYDSGARVQEIADLTMSSLRLAPPAQVTLMGKGRKQRVVPLMANTASVIGSYIEEYGLAEPHCMQYPLFRNHQKQKMTRAGIAYILKKYADMAREKSPNFPQGITPHVLRHSKAMHLLEAGVNVVYIRDILGHADVSTTEIYAKANMAMKRAALEKVSHIASCNVPSWTCDKSLMEWLNSFGKSL